MARTRLRYSHDRQAVLWRDCTFLGYRPPPTDGESAEEAAASEGKKHHLLEPAKAEIHPLARYGYRPKRPIGPEKLLEKEGFDQAKYDAAYGEGADLPPQTPSEAAAEATASLAAETEAAYKPVEELGAPSSMLLPTPAQLMAMPIADAAEDEVSKVGRAGGPECSSTVSSVCAVALWKEERQRGAARGRRGES